MPISGYLCGSISIHAPRMGSDLRGFSYRFSTRLFQSTPPAWGAKSIFCMPAPWLPIFQSTPPRMGSDVNIPARVVALSISIHAPAWGATSMQEAMGLHKWIFQSTLPAWGATSAHQSEDDDEPHISIHAPRMGSDINRGIPPHAPRAFQSTPPHGERRRSTRSTAKS